MKFLKKEKECYTLIRPLSGLNAETPVRAADKACKPSAYLVNTPGLHLTYDLFFSLSTFRVQTLPHNPVCFPALHLCSVAAGYQGHYDEDRFTCQVTRSENEEGMFLFLCT